MDILLLLLQVHFTTRHREFSKYVKKAKHLRKIYEQGKLSEQDLEKARSQFKGIYRHVLDNVLEEKPE